MKIIILCLIGFILQIQAKEPVFQSHFFNEGELVYSDDFNDSFQEDFWEIRQETQWEVKDGMFIGRPAPKEYQDKFTAKGDKWHGGFGPIIRLNHIPDKFVCHFRLKYVGETSQELRPLLDVGHHVNSFMYGTRGPQLKLLKGKVFKNLKAPLEQNKWYDIVIEFEEGRMLYQVNGVKQIFKHKQITMKGFTQFTFKAIQSPESRLLFDYVRMWKIK